MYMLTIPDITQGLFCAKIVILNSLKLTQCIVYTLMIFINISSTL